MNLTLKDGRTVEVRPLQANDDVFDLARFINELTEEKAHFTMNMPFSPEEVADWLRNEMSEIEKDECIHWRVFLGGKNVGWTHAKRGKWKENGNVELGIGLSKEVRGQGLGKNLMEAMVEEARKRWDPRNVYLEMSSGNDRARRLYTSMGFKEVARLKNWINHYGAYMDKVVMVLE